MVHARALRILVLEAQVPFVHGGAEILVRELTGALRRHGHEAAIVSVPFCDDPKEEILAGAASWRELDVTTAGGRPVDLVIATKFPTYFARHPRKILWLVHQHRAAYELCGTIYSDFRHTDRDVGLRRRLLETDTSMLRECASRFTIAKTVSARLLKYNGVESEPLYNPPKLASRLRRDAYGDFVLTVTRLERVKRVDLAINAIADAQPGLRLLVAGDGSARRELQELIDRRGLHDRVSLLGRVDDEQLIDLYARALAVLFVPFAEDYGYVTLEAFLSRKPVITAHDAGGPLEFVVNDVNGFVCDPAPEDLARAIDRLAANPGLAEQLGERGHAVAHAITWDHVVERLVAGGAGEARGRAGEGREAGGASRAGEGDRA